jgi:hypothetical protein
LHYIAHEVTPQEWDALLDGFPGHTVFHSLSWLRTIEAVHGASFQLARVDEITEEAPPRCVGVWPVFSTRKGPLRILGSPVPGWCTAYQGPLLAPNCDAGAVVSAFLRHDLFKHGSYFSCKVLTEELDIDLTRFGFEEVEKLDTYCIDLTLPEQTLWANLKSECRTRVRKAEKLGVRVQHETDASFIDDFWRMSLETFAICGIKPGFTKPFLTEMWRRLHSDGRVRAMSAFIDDERIATLILPHDLKTMYYWAGASFLRFRGIPAHNLLHWQAIRLSQELGLQRYDFVSTAGNGGRFKKTFGPQTIHMATQWERTSSRLVRALKSGYQQWRLWQQRASA